MFVKNPCKLCGGLYYCQNPLRRKRSENISHSFSFTMASCSKCLRVPTDQLENVVNEICSDDDSGDEIMIPELDEVDSDNNTVIDNDPQDSNHEHLPTTSAVPDTPIS